VGHRSGATLNIPRFGFTAAGGTLLRLRHPPLSIKAICAVILYLFFLPFSILNSSNIPLYPS